MRITKFLKRNLTLLLAGCLLAFSFAVILPPAPVFAQDAPASVGASASTAATEEESTDEPGVLDTLTSIGESIYNFGDTISGAIYGMVSAMLLAIVELLGWLLGVTVLLLKTVTAYTGFSEQRQVIAGWQIVRDIINSFFIVVLIAIAISTIIRFQAFNFRSTLPRLIIAAFLVNFSRTFCLLAINFSTSIMHTFVVHVEKLLPVFAIGLRAPALIASQDATINGLYGDTTQVLATDPKPKTDFISGIISLLFAIVMMVAALFAMFYFLIILIFRIIVLWFLMILSPLAFFLWGVPGKGQSYWGEWMDEFTKHVIIGPVTAFFLYIIIYFYVYNTQGNYGFNIAAAADGQKLPQLTLTLASRPDIILGYIVSLGLMFVAFELTQKIGVRGGQFAAKFATEGARKTFGALTAPLRAGAKATAWGAGYGRDWLYSKGGRLAPLLRPSDTYGAIMEGFGKRRDKLIADGREKLGERAAKAERAGEGLTSLYYSAGAANAQFFEKNGILSMMMRTAKAAIPGRRADMDKLATDLDVIQNRDLARTAFSTEDGATALGALSSLSVSKLQAGTAIVDKYKEKRENLQKIEAGLALGGVDPSQWAANADWSAAKSELDAITGALPRGRDRAQLELSELDIIAANDKQAKEFADKLKVKDKDNPTGIIDESAINTSVGDFAKSLEDPEGKERDTRRSLASKIASRRAAAGVALAGAHAGFEEKVDEYRGKTYKPEHEYDESQLVNNLLAHENKNDKYEYVGDLIQAAKQGRLENVMQKVVPDFTMDPAGFEKFMGHVEAKLGMDDQEALKTLSKLQVYTGKDGKWAQSNMVQETPSGYKLRDDGERNKAIANGISTKDLYDVLVKSKPDGLGIKNAQGQYEMNQGVVAAIRQGNKQLAKILDNPRDITRIPPAVLKALRDNQKQLALSKDSIDRINEVLP